MISQEMVNLGTTRSIIREIFEYAKIRAAEIGAENVLDFSIGNPSVPAPQNVQDTIIDILHNEPPRSYHSYTSAQGNPEVRKAIADNLNKRYGTSYNMENFFMTCGASAALNIVFKAVLSAATDEVIVFAPFFPEYRVFIETKGARLVVLKSDSELCIDTDILRAGINKNTKIVIINSPNNPSGVVYPKENLDMAVAVIKEKEKEYGHPIFIVADEPYRELVYNDAVVTHIPLLYDNTIICYSWSKSLSIPGERLGYVLIPDSVINHKDVYAAVAGAARSLGYVCAPSLFQRVIERCVDTQPDLTVYKTNRDILYNSLKEMGYNVAKPNGAFYMFIEAPEGDGEKFAERAKQHDVLVVPGASFGEPSYVRLSYCVETEKIKKAVEIFKKLI